MSPLKTRPTRLEHGAPPRDEATGRVVIYTPGAQEAPGSSVPQAGRVTVYSPSNGRDAGIAPASTAVRGNCHAHH